MKTKMMMVAVMALVLMAGEAVAQFEMSGEFRPRTELRHGFQNLMPPDTDAAFFISQRTRLNLNHTDHKLSFRLVLQDVRVWGDNPQLNRFDNNSSVYEAWGEYRFTENFALRAGRQELVYDESRIFGNVDWAQQGRSHDLALFKYQNESSLKLHFGLAFNQMAERNTGTVYTIPNNYKTMQFVWFNKKFDANTLSLLLLNNGVQVVAEVGNEVYFSQTAGGRFEHKQDTWNAGIEAYLQTGKDPQNRDVSAWYAGLNTNRKLSDKLTLNFGFEWLSGTDLADMADASYNKNHSFTPLYGTNHKFNGHMDYFYVGNHINNVGLINPYGGFTFRKDKFSVQLALHAFMSDGLLPDPAQAEKNMPRYLGTEADVLFGYTFSPQFSIRAGHSQMLATESMEVLKGGSRKESNHWAWVMLVMKPQFIKN
jgi:hypothetical protein